MLVLRGGAFMNPAKTAHWEQFIPNSEARWHDQVHEVMRFCHYSFRTEEAYIIELLQPGYFTAKS